MDAQESQQKFQQADQLFQAGRYQEALNLLDELNRAFPNAVNVLYPAALCLEKLGRVPDALSLCEQMIAQFQDPRAQELKARLSSPQPPPVPAYTGYQDPLEELGLTGAGDLLDLGPSTVPAYTPPPAESNWWKYALGGVGFVLFLAFLIIPPLMYEPPPPTPGNPTPSYDPDGWVQAIGTGAVILMVVLSYVGYLSGGYVALMLMHQLPHDSFSDNLISVGGTTLFATGVSFIPVVGPFMALYIIAQAYELGCGGLLLFQILGGLGSFAAVIIPLVMFVGSVSALVPA